MELKLLALIQCSNQCTMHTGHATLNMKCMIASVPSELKLEAKE